MNVLAIGATGFIGSHVLRLLVEQEHEVLVFHRGQTNPDLPAGVRDIRGNRDRLRDFRSQLERFAPDVVIDLLLYTEAQARELVETFRGTEAHIVGISSADVYRNYDGLRGQPSAPPDPAPLTEGSPLRDTRYPYRGAGLSFAYAEDYEKILVEQLLLDAPGLATTVLRLPAVYGPGDKQHRLQPYLSRMRNDPEKILLEDGQAGWRWTRGFVENVAAAIALVATRPPAPARIYNVGDEPTLSELEWVRQIASRADWQGEVVEVPRSELPEDARQAADWDYQLWTDTSALYSQTGYVAPVALDEALRRTVEWERSVLGCS